MKKHPDANLVVLHFSPEILKKARGIILDSPGRDPEKVTLEELPHKLSQVRGGSASVRFMLMLPREPLSLGIKSTWKGWDLWVDGRPWTETGKANFSGGPHFLRISGRVLDAKPEGLPLLIQTLGTRAPGGWTGINAMFPIPKPYGLRAWFYKDPKNLDSTVNFSRVLSVPRYRFFDVPFEPLHMPFMIKGEAWIHPQKEGRFKISNPPDQHLRVSLDGQEVFVSVPDRPLREKFFTLRPGTPRWMTFWHRVKPVRLWERTLELRWIQEGATQEEPIPASWLEPDLKGSWTSLD